jgi:lambda family phage minor tail protein L
MQEALKSAPSRLVDLFEVYFPPDQFTDAELASVAPELGDSNYADVTTMSSYRTLRFFTDLNLKGEEVTWQGKKYALFPVLGEGFEYSSSGQLPTPNFTVANIGGLVTILNLALNDFIGAKVIRHRTMIKFLDAVNFEEGNVSADPLAEFPQEVYFVDRKVEETDEYVKYELASALDITSVKLPRRTILQNHCFWVFKDANCGYTGTAYGSCKKTLDECKLRFPPINGVDQALPFGGFPGAGLLQY